MSYYRFCPANPSPSPFGDEKLWSPLFSDDMRLSIPEKLCHAVQLLGQEDMARWLWDYFRDNASSYACHRQLPRWIRDFRDPQKHLHQGTLILHNVHRVPSLAGVLGLAPSIYLVTLSESPNFSHSVCVCTRRNLILDCTETRSLRLCWESLPSCIGNPDTFPRAQEIRRVNLSSASWSRAS